MNGDRFVKPMEHFVLVHGAWHGGWCWEKVFPFLQGAGYGVTAPTLSGLGERSDELSGEINLSRHRADILRIIEEKDLRDIILVGHSYGGMVVASVSEVIPERISRLIYLDAAVPLDGRSVVDLAPAFSSMARELDTPQGAVRVIPSPPPEAFGIIDREEIAWIKPLLSPMPYNALTEEIEIGNPAAARIPVSYILCAGQFSSASASAHLAAFKKLQSEGHDCRLIDLPHDMMITHPRELADLLMDCASKT
jgi:pimeloyl-ACP methyl ester carboxylesterase